jgi:flagellar biosynthesis GTPase FlhF
MSSPLLVKISRDGKEIGTYEVKEAVRLLVYGTLKESDFYWHEGMTEWAPLLKLQASEARRQLAERAEQLKQEEAIKAEQLKQEEAIKAEQLKQEEAIKAEQLAQEQAFKYEQLARERAKAKEEEKAKAKQNEDAISTAARALWVKKMATERLDEAGGCFKAVGVGALLIGGVALLAALTGDDGGSAIRQQVRTQQMTNGILLMILGCIIAKR